jgi:type II secretory pathway pseudopilin PulG
MGKKNLKIKKRFSFKGDTIIEVIIGIALLGVTIAAAYISTTHSLREGTDAGNRNRAVGFAQQQIEVLVQSFMNNTVSQYTGSPDQPFCVHTDGSLVGKMGDTCTVCVNSDGIQDQLVNQGTSCPSGDNGLYDMNTVYKNGIFTTTINWQAPNGSGHDSAVQYYKLPESVPGPPPPPTLIVNGDIYTNLDQANGFNHAIRVTLQAFFNGLPGPSVVQSQQRGPNGLVANSFQVNAGGGSPLKEQLDSIGERSNPYSFNIDISKLGTLDRVNISFNLGVNKYRNNIKTQDHHEVDAITVKQIKIANVFGSKFHCSGCSSYYGPAAYYDPMPPYQLWLPGNNSPVNQANFIPF